MMSIMYNGRPLTAERVFTAPICRLRRLIVSAQQSLVRRREMMGAAEWRAATSSRHRPERLSLQVIGDRHFFAPAMVLNKALRLRGVELTTEAGPQVAIKWSPWSIYQIPAHLRPSLPGRIINDTHFNCSKANVAHHFEQTFGYSLAVDPTAHHGPLVRKSDKNAVHDGEIIHGPIHVEPGVFYSRLIDNRVGSHVEDIRVPIFDGLAPFCYVKYRPARSRFSNANTLCALQWPQDIFSRDELQQIMAFARSIGLEFGEMDVLRDGASLLVYIVDANNTPAGPPNGLPENEKHTALQLIGSTFAERFLQ